MGVYFLYMTYDEQLQDIHWKEKRHQIILRDLEMCQVCMSSKSLEVHHKVYYTDGRMAWEYPDITMTTLCHQCHESFHQNYKVPVTKPDRLLDLFQKLQNSFDSLRGLVQSTGKRYG